MAKKLFNVKFLSLALTIALLLGTLATPMGMLASAADYTAEELGIRAATTVDFTKAENCANLTYGDGSATDTSYYEYNETEGALQINSLKLNDAYNAEFNTAGNIDEFSIKIKMSSSPETYKRISPEIVYYNGAEAISGFVIFADNSSGRKYWTLQYAYNGSAISSGSVTIKIYPADFDWTANYATITLKYGDTYSKNASKTLYSKHITDITVTKEDGTAISTANGSVTSHSEIANVTGNNQYLAYGANRYNAEYDDAYDTSIAEPTTAKVGFKNSFSTTKDKVYIKDISVTYKNVSIVEEFISAIGEVEKTAESLAKIEKAEAAYALLSSAQQAEVSNYGVLTAARAAYNALVEDAPIEEVETLINAIGSVDASEECLAKITAAETAYEALSESQKEKVSNYSVLVEAKKAYNAAKYGITPDKTLDFTNAENCTGFTYGDGSATNSSYYEYNETEGALQINALRNNEAYNAEFDTKADIDTFSIKMKMSTSPNTATRSSTEVVYYNCDSNGTETVSNFVVLGDASNGRNYWTIQYGNNVGTISSARTTIKIYPADFDWTANYAIVTLKYGDVFAKNSNNSIYSKHITDITVTKEDGTAIPTTNGSVTSHTDIDITGGYDFYLAYGINRFNAECEDSYDATIPEPTTAKIGFRGYAKSGTKDKTYIKDMTVTYKNTAAVEKVNAISEIAVDNTAECAEKINEIAKTYELLPASQQSAELTEAINAAKEASKIAVNAEAPQVLGGTIKATDNVAEQGMRFTTKFPQTAPEDYKLVEYGTVMLPTRMLADDELTLATEKIAFAKSAVAEDQEFDATEWNTTLRGIDFTSSDQCGTRISTRSYVKYSNGTNEIIIYSKNTSDSYNSADPTKGVSNGVCVRSVYSLARLIAADVVNTADYSEELGAVVWTEEVTSETNVLSSDTANGGVLGADLLKFLVANQSRISAISTYKASK